MKEIVAVGVVSLRGLDVDGYSEGQWRLIGETDDDADTTWAQGREAGMWSSLCGEEKRY